jgi:hypothetical protein
MQASSEALEGPAGIMQLGRAATAATAAALRHAVAGVCLVWSGFALALFLCKLCTWQAQAQARYL